MLAATNKNFRAFERYVTRRGADHHLDFGCGAAPRNPFNLRVLTTCDTHQATPSHPTNLIKPGDAIPFSDNTFDTVSLYDVLEHISRDFKGRNLYVFYMNEIFRILKPGGIAVIIFPKYPSGAAFSDPTHVNYIPRESVDYFIGTKEEPFYAGISCSFKLRLNANLRFWKNWVPDNEINNIGNQSIRRTLSLARREVLRILRPTHAIWVLEKPSTARIS